MALSMYSGIILGVVVRTFVPYLVKLKTHPRIKWENIYLVSAFAGLALALLTSLIIIVQFNTPMDFWTAFCTAFTLQSLSREAQKALGY